MFLYLLIYVLVTTWTGDVPDIWFRFQLAVYLAILSNPVPASVLAKTIPGTGYLAWIVTYCT